MNIRMEGKSQIMGNSMDYIYSAGDQQLLMEEADEKHQAVGYRTVCEVQKITGDDPGKSCKEDREFPEPILQDLRAGITIRLWKCWSG